jgi:hypothetical protein
MVAVFPIIIDVTHLFNRSFNEGRYGDFEITKSLGMIHQSAHDHILHNMPLILGHTLG